MKRMRHTPEQILRDAEVQLGTGVTIAEVSRALGVSEAPAGLGAGAAALASRGAEGAPAGAQAKAAGFE